MKKHISAATFLMTTFLLLSIFQQTQSQTFSDRKEVIKTFKVSNETTVEVDNKYGKIQIIPWSKDSVKFYVDFSIGSSSLSRLEKIKNSVNFDFTGTRYYVSARTDFGSTGNQIFTELKNLSDIIMTGSNKVQINYTIYCPENLNLNIINKFGDIFIDDIRGNLKISLSNGDFKINSIKGQAQIEMGFGSGIINSVDELQLTIAYSDLKIKEAGKLTIDSKSTTVNIDKASYLKLTSRRDKYFISELENLYGNADFTQIWLDAMNCETDCSLKYGNISISKISKDFCKINVTSEYTDVSLKLNENSRYDADLFYHRDALVSYPQNIDNYGLKVSDDTDFKKHAHYKTGAGDNLPLLRIYAIQKCSISIGEK